MITSMLEAVRERVADATLDEVTAAAALAYCQDAANVGTVDAHGARLAAVVGWFRANVGASSRRNK